MNKKILNVGCGGSKEYNKRNNIGNYNIDIRKPLIQIPNFQIMNVENMTFKDNYFDSVYIIDVIEHLENPTKALKEIKRVLKPKGKLVIGTPNANYGLCFFYCLKHGTTKPHYDHIAVWGKAELENLLKRAGFTNFKVYSARYIDEPHKLIASILLKILPKSMQRQLVAEVIK